jgi:hypothetical protein
VSLRRVRLEHLPTDKVCLAADIPGSEGGLANIVGGSRIAFMLLKDPFLAHSLRFWEHAEYTFTAFVIVACIGEAIAEFSRPELG